MPNGLLALLFEAFLAKAMPVALVVGIVGILFVEVRRGLERRLFSSRVGRLIRKSSCVRPCGAADLPRCPTCKVQTAGDTQAGKPFRGCRNYPKCFGTVVV